MTKDYKEAFRDYYYSTIHPDKFTEEEINYKKNIAINLEKEEVKKRLGFSEDTSWDIVSKNFEYPWVVFEIGSEYYEIVSAIDHKHFYDKLWGEDKHD